MQEIHNLPQCILRLFLTSNIRKIRVNVCLRIDLCIRLSKCHHTAHAIAHPLRHHATQQLSEHNEHDDRKYPVKNKTLKWRCLCRNILRKIDSTVEELLRQIIILPVTCLVDRSLFLSIRGLRLKRDLTVSPRNFCDLPHH